MYLSTNPHTAGLTWKCASEKRHDFYILEYIWEAPKRWWDKTSEELAEMKREKPIPEWLKNVVAPVDRPKNQVFSFIITNLS